MPSATDQFNVNPPETSTNTFEPNGSGFLPQIPPSTYKDILNSKDMTNKMEERKTPRNDLDDLSKMIANEELYIRREKLVNMNCEDSEPYYPTPANSGELR